MASKTLITRVKDFEDRVDALDAMQYVMTAVLRISIKNMILNSGAGIFSALVLVSLMIIRGSSDGYVMYGMSAALMALFAASVYVFMNIAQNCHSDLLKDMRVIQTDEDLTKVKGFINDADKCMKAYRLSNWIALGAIVLVALFGASMYFSPLASPH